MSKAGGFARTNIYTVHIPVLDLFKNADKVAEASGWTDGSYFTALYNTDANSVAKRLVFFCKKAELPGMEFETDEQRYYGEPFRYPYMPIYTNMNLTFYVGNDMLERFFFDAWMFTIMDPDTHDFNYISEYSTDIVVTQYKITGETAYQVKLYDAYPIALNPMDVSYDDTDRVHELSVTFAYKRYLPTNLYFDNTTGTGIRGNPIEFNDTLA